MNTLDYVLDALEVKYGPIAYSDSDADKESCSHFFYDDDCKSCKGNATGN